jgi:hypothetical protein
MKKRFLVIISSIALPWATCSAEEIHGKIQSLEGHINPACRTIFLKNDAGELSAYRVPNTQNDNSILAVAMMAYSQDRKVTIVYVPGSTTGCGSEPRIDIFRISRPD